MTAPDYAQPRNGVPLPLWDGTPADWRPKSAAADFVPNIVPFLLPAEKSKGFVLVCPGGGYGHRAAHEGAPIAEAFNELGFSAAVVHYRTTGECEAPLRDGPLRDAARAVRIVRAHAPAWGTAPDRISILGFSAGGHLVGSLAVHHKRADEFAKEGDGLAEVSSRPDAALPCYPVLLAAPPYNHSGSIIAIAGDDPARVAAWDVPSNVTADTPPCFLWHTQEDQAVPMENSIALATALHKHKIHFALHVFSRGSHGKGLGPDFPEIRVWPRLAADWLENIAFAR